MFCLFNYKIIFSVLLLFLWESEKQILCFSGSVAFAIHLWWMWHPRFRIPKLVMSQLGEIILEKINMSHLRSSWSSKKTKILFSVETSTERQNQEQNVKRLVSKSYQYSESRWCSHFCSLSIICTDCGHHAAVFLSTCMLFFSVISIWL